MNVISIGSFMVDNYSTSLLILVLQRSRHKYILVCYNNLFSIIIFFILVVYNWILLFYPDCIVLSVCSII